MKDKELDKKLLEASNEAEKFFSHIDMSNIKNNTKIKIKCVEDTNSFNRRYKFKSVYTKIGAISICILILILIPYAFNISISNDGYSDAGKPISQQPIKLSSNEESQWLNFFKINKPDRSSNLLAVIYKYNTNGDYKVIYSSLFENSENPQPVSTITFPKGQYPMLLISSQNKQREFLHYRVVGYKNGKILSYLKQDFVPEGEVKVINGVLREKRIIPAEYESNTDNVYKSVVTYYIPYYIDEYGNVILSTNHLRIRKGENVAIIGDNNSIIGTYSSGHLIEKEQYNIEYSDNNIKYLYAETCGKENIYIKPKEGIAKKLFVTVEDDEL